MLVRLMVPKEPMPQHSKALAIACCALLVPTAAMAIIISPLAFNRLYITDNVAANYLGMKLQIAIFWVRCGRCSLSAESHARCQCCAIPYHDQQTVLLQADNMGDDCSPEPGRDFDTVDVHDDLLVGLCHQKLLQR